MTHSIIKKIALTSVLTIIVSSSIVACGKKEEAKAPEINQPTNQEHQTADDHSSNNSAVATAETQPNTQSEANSNEAIATADGSTQDSVTAEAVAMADDVKE